MHTPDERSHLELSDDGDGLLSARTDPDFWNQIGPFGGWLAAVSLRALRFRLAPEFLPRSFSCTFIDQIEPGEFKLRVRDVARKRTLQAREVQLVQGEKVCVTAQCVFGLDRDQPDLKAECAQRLAPAGTLDSLPFMGKLAKFTDQFEYRIASGSAFGGDAPSRSVGYVRLKSPGDRHGPEDLLLLADSWFPALWTQTSGPVPATTVTYCAVFHTPDTRPSPRDFFQIAVSSSAIKHGYADETTELRDSGGVLLLKAQQLLWLNFSREHRTVGAGEPPR